MPGPLVIVCSEEEGYKTGFCKAGLFSFEQHLEFMTKGGLQTEQSGLKISIHVLTP